jgi:hypothetical protein
MNATNETANTWAQLQTMAAGVAAAMGYTVKPRPESNHGGYAEIVGPDGRGFSLNTAIGLADRGKVHISGSFPDRLDGRQIWTVGYGKTRPSINVSLSKSPAAVAKEIERRLMADYLPLLDECKKTLAQWTARRDSTAEVSAKLAKSIGGKVRTSDNPTADARIDVPGVYVEVSVSGDRVRFDRLTVGADVAAQILALVVASERGTD